MFGSIIAISIGASLGAISRWLLGMGLNSVFPTLPPGTLVANLLGGYLIGVAITLFAGHPSIAPEWRLLVVTGFLGGLTTFSTFSAETASLAQQGRYLWAVTSIGVHTGGSVLMTLFGIYTVNLLKAS
jgi:CrcB protein